MLGPTASVFVYPSPLGHVFNIAWPAMIKAYVRALILNGLCYLKGPLEVQHSGTKSMKCILLMSHGQVYISIAGLILGLPAANGGRCNFVTTSFISWAQTHYQPCPHTLLQHKQQPTKIQAHGVRDPDGRTTCYVWMKRHKTNPKAMVSI